MKYVFPPVEMPSLEVAGSEARFPVRRIYCVGRNYEAHSREMGHDPDREAPFFFEKSPHTLIPGNSNFSYPPCSSDVQFEIEMVVALAKGGIDIDVDEALEHIYGYAVGLDMTRRDLQGEAKRLGRPWEVGKSFEQSAPCSAIHSADEVGYPDSGAIWLKVNGETRQNGDLNEMIWTVPEIIGHLSRLFTLAPGDLIFTGTPAGVGPIEHGDVMLGCVENVAKIKIKVV